MLHVLSYVKSIFNHETVEFVTLSVRACDSHEKGCKSVDPSQPILAILHRVPCVTSIKRTCGNVAMIFRFMAVCSKTHRAFLLLSTKTRARFPLVFLKNVFSNRFSRHIVEPTRLSFFFFWSRFYTSFAMICLSTMSTENIHRKSRQFDRYHAYYAGLCSLCNVRHFDTSGTFGTSGTSGTLPDILRTKRAMFRVETPISLYSPMRSTNVESGFVVAAIDVTVHRVVVDNMHLRKHHTPP